MTSKANIVYEKADNSFSYRYHQTEGDVYTLGNTLLKHVSTINLVEDLFNLNTNFSTINLTVEQYDTNYKKLERQGNLILKTFMALESQFTQKKIGSIITKGFAIQLPVKVNNQRFILLKHIFNHCTNEYVYLFNQKKKWLVSKNKSGFIPLDHAFKIEACKKLYYYFKENNTKENRDDLIKHALDIYHIYYKFSQKEKAKYTPYLLIEGNLDFINLILNDVVKTNNIKL